MKKILFVAAMLLSSVCAMAQHEVGSITVQPKVGLSISSISGMKDVNIGIIDAKCKSRYGLVAGLEAEYQATEQFGISAGALYSMEGAKMSYTVDAFGLASASGNYTLKYDYINVPILVNFYPIEGLALKAGIQPGFNISHSDEAETKGDKIFQQAQASYKSNEVNTFVLSIPFGASYEYNNFVIDARYNLGVTKMFKNSYADSKSNTIQITLGYKFDL